MAKRTSSRSKAARKAPDGELALIEHIRLHAARVPAASAVALGIGDDCAILRPDPADEIVITTDFSLEGRHFRRDWHSPASIGHRTLARGLSDVAAMGARPVAAFLSLALPLSVAQDVEWLDGFLDGLLTLAATHDVALAGGDTSHAPGNEVLADIMVVGSAPRGTALRRSGARAGDLLYCTGSLGGAAQELLLLEAYPATFGNATAGAQKHPHLFPQPRIATGMALRERVLATACMDLSDGLSTDLAHLCTASGVAAEVDFDALPVARSLRGKPMDVVERCVLHGGEDYELLFTASPSSKLPKVLGGVKLTCIGRVLARKRGQPQVTLLRGGAASPLLPNGWEHFQSQ